MINGINLAQSTSTQTSSNSSQYPENLSEICNSCDSRDKNYGKYTKQQIEIAFDKRNAREYAAFGHFAGDASSQGIKNLAEAYVNYVSSLSPDEQNSAGYKGTKETATALLAAANSQIADEKAHPGKKSAKALTLIEMMLDNMMKNLKKNANPADTSSNSASTEQVTISAEALKLSSQA